MDLWIRSQYKGTLIKVENIQTNNESIICFDRTQGVIVLGEYDNKERALEVLDEIQSYLIPKVEYLGNKDLLGNDCKFYDINNIQTLVYEMPKE